MILGSWEIEEILCFYHDQVTSPSVRISFDSPEGPKAQASKTRVDVMIIILIFVNNCMYTMLYMIFQYENRF